MQCSRASIWTASCEPRGRRSSRGRPKSRSCDRPVCLANEARVCTHSRPGPARLQRSAPRSSEVVEKENRCRRSMFGQLPLTREEARAVSCILLPETTSDGNKPTPRALRLPMAAAQPIGAGRLSFCRRVSASTPHIVLRYNPRTHGLSTAWAGVLVFMS